jgi:hypothetical protein
VTTREFDVAVRDLLGAALDRACDILQNRRTDPETGVGLLRATLTADDFPAICSAKTSVERWPVVAAG